VEREGRVEAGRVEGERKIVPSESEVGEGAAPSYLRAMVMGALNSLSSQGACKEVDVCVGE
jgi:hypothetical protein